MNRGRSKIKNDDQNKNENIEEERWKFKVEE